MFRFEESGILWFLLALPILLVLFAFVLKSKRNTLTRYGDYALLERLMPGLSIKKLWLKTTFFTVAMMFLIIAWANPQWGYRTEKVKVKSSDIVIALDISESMLAEDISPNRMERAKFFVSELAKRLQGNRIGLIYFAGSAYLQMPLSSDLASAQTFIKTANPSQAGTQGTVIADAIQLSESIFDIDDPTQKALIIISDGENHESEAIAAAREASKNGISTFTLGIGTTEGAFIPVVQRGKKVLKTDREGNAVKTALNQKNLQDIARAGNGKFYMIDQSMRALNEIETQIERLEKKEVEQRSFTDFNSYYQVLLALGLILIIADLFIGNKTSGVQWFKKIIGT